MRHFVGGEAGRRKLHFVRLCAMSGLIQEDSMVCGGEVCLTWTSVDWYGKQMVANLPGRSLGTVIPARFFELYVYGVAWKQ